MTDRKTTRIAVLISGRGSNLRALIDACAAPDFPAEIVCVLSNKPDAGGIAHAEKAGIPVEIVWQKDYTSKAEFESAMLAALGQYPVDLICLAGFMRILSPNFIARWPDRILNIHPSLLPDYKGLDVHERVVADKCAESGCSVHFVVPETDAGPVIVQERVPVLPDDTPDTLAARILAREHVAYPKAVRLFAEGKLLVRGNSVAIQED